MASIVVRTVLGGTFAVLTAACRKCRFAEEVHLRQVGGIPIHVRGGHLAGLRQGCQGHRPDRRGHPAAEKGGEFIPAQQVQQVVMQLVRNFGRYGVPAFSQPVESQGRVGGEIGADVVVGGDPIGHAAIGRLEVGGRPQRPGDVAGGVGPLGRGIQIGVQGDIAVGHYGLGQPLFPTHVGIVLDVAEGPAEIADHRRGEHGFDHAYIGMGAGRNPHRFVDCGGRGGAVAGRGFPARGVYAPARCARWHRRPRQSRASATEFQIAAAFRCQGQPDVRSLVGREGHIVCKRPLRPLGQRTGNSNLDLEMPLPAGAVQSR